MADLLEFPSSHALPEAAVPSPREARQTTTLNDTESRAAALDIQRSWIVEAPAGSGKTGLLIQRLLKLLAFGDVEQPGDVLAITFTRKADAELRTRVLRELSAAAAHQPLAPGAAEFEVTTRQLATAVLARDHELRWQLLDNPHQLNIRTIDSFCAELAGSMPLLSGGSGRRKPVDDAQPLYQRAAERTFRELGGPDQELSRALADVLLHRDAQIGDCVRLLADMLQQREQWGELIPLSPEKLTDEYLDREVRPRLEQTLESVICQALSRAARAIDPALLHDLARFAARLGDEPGYRGNPSPIAVCAGRPGAPAARAEDLEHWLALVHLLFTKDGWRNSASRNHLGFDLPRSEQQPLKDLIALFKAEEQRRPDLRDALCDLRLLPPARYPDEQWRMLKALCRVLRRGLIELQLVFSERDACDFTEVALAARTLLRSQSLKIDPVTTPGARLRHLLVDEMQDTSAGQYELLESLTHSWDGATQTVFLVGDPKQSIYYFRQARVERFLHTMTDGRLGDVPLQALRLTSNFRSQAMLVREFNRTFELILPPPGAVATNSSDTSDVPFVSAAATRPAGRSPALHWHTHVEPRRSSPRPTLDEEHDPPAPTAEQDARTIRTTIEEFLTRWQPADGAAKPRIAVLARNRAHLAPVIAEFHRDRGHGPLLFRAVDVEPLNERPEVLDLLALTRALLHPGDRIAWLAVLHSPVCGLGRADLLTLTGEGPDADRTATVPHLVATRRELLSPEGQGLVQRTWPVLAEAQATLGRTDFSTHVERTWRSLGADAPLRPDQRTNARRFLDLLRKFEAGPEPLGVALLERGLRSLYAEPIAADTPVELMTIHKAKGLEWDLVLVPSLQRGSGRGGHELLKWLELGTARAEPEFVLAPIQNKGEDSTTLSAWLSRLQQLRETAECKRLFYVACTRAREELHLFGSVERKQDGELCKPRHDSLLRAAWAAAEPVFQNEPGPAAGALIPFPERPEGPERLVALAAAADPAPGSMDRPLRRPSLYRLPPDFDPLARFRPEVGPNLPYLPATALRHESPFARPQGSFAARAFGNAVHRFLQLLAGRLEQGSTVPLLLDEIAGWEPRLAATLRSEGLAPTLAAREASRAVTALTATLRDRAGAWLLAAHPGARSERAFISPAGEAAPATGALRADRTFFAGPDPLSSTAATHLWIVDFKTAEQGGRGDDAFFEGQKEKYLPQMQAYAAACTTAGVQPDRIVLALYFPLLGRLVHWPAAL